MAAQVIYTNFGGQIVHEDRGGTERDYMPDTLGSTIALLDSDSNQTDTWEYWPYGEVESRTGANVTPFSFVGTLGYFNDLVARLTYVRARHYQSLLGQWTSVDTLWPREPSYLYAYSNPVSIVDPSGRRPRDCSDEFCIDLRQETKICCRVCKKRWSICKKVQCDFTINPDDADDIAELCGLGGAVFCISKCKGNLICAAACAAVVAAVCLAWKFCRDDCGNVCVSGNIIIFPGVTNAYPWCCEGTGPRIDRGEKSKTEPIPESI